MIKLKHTFRVLLAMPFSELSQNLVEQFDSLNVHTDSAASLVEIIQKIHKSEKYDLVVVSTNAYRINCMEVASFTQNSLQHKPALVAVSNEYCISEKRRCLNAGMSDYTDKPTADFWFEIIDKISLNKSAQNQNLELVPLFSVEKTERMCQAYSQEHLDRLTHSFVNRLKESMQVIQASMKFFDIKVVGEQLEIIKHQSQQVGALAMLNAVQKSKEQLFSKPDLERELEGLHKIAELSFKKITKMLVSKTEKQSVMA